MGVITYPCQDYSDFMLFKGAADIELRFQPVAYFCCPDLCKKRIFLREHKHVHVTFHIRPHSDDS